MPKKTLKKKAHAKTKRTKPRVASRKQGKHLSQVKRVVKVAAQGVKAKAEAAKHLSADQLIVKGKERGYITYNEILKAFPHVEDDVDFLESLYERFSTAGIDVLEGGMLEDSADDYLATKNIKDRQSTSYDSIQIYLREIGQYPLLTAAEERELAKRI